MVEVVKQLPPLVMKYLQKYSKNTLFTPTFIREGYYYPSRKETSSTAYSAQSEPTIDVFKPHRNTITFYNRTIIRLPRPVTDLFMVSQIASLLPR